MKRITRCLAVLAALFLTASPVVAADQSVVSGEPVRLTDAELDEVTAGQLALNLDLYIRDAQLDLQLNNLALNAGAVIQANVMGDSVQSAQAIAVQSVTQQVAP
jgi:hypothetical protein